MKKYQTELKIVCAWCGKPMGTKDGKGVTGTTSGICPDCVKKEMAKLPKQPARWNLVGRFLERRRARKRYHEAEDQETDDGFLADMFATNPGLHARVILQGRRFVHYIEPEDISALTERVAGEPEIRCRWN